VALGTTISTNTLSNVTSSTDRTLFCGLLTQVIVMTTIHTNNFASFRSVVRLVVAAVAMGGWEKIPLRWIKRATGFLGDIGGEGRARYIRRMCRLGSHSVKQLSFDGIGLLGGMGEKVRNCFISYLRCIESEVESVESWTGSEPGDWQNLPVAVVDVRAMWFFVALGVVGRVRGGSRVDPRSFPRAGWTSGAFSAQCDRVSIALRNVFLEVGVHSRVAHSFTLMINVLGKVVLDDR
jgi:hypothetical protein